MTPRRITAILVVLLVMVSWSALIRPTALGGPATFIMISGDSMEPTYSQGDLVVLRKASSYEPGDIVAYPMQTYFNTGRLVIHRVVSEDAGGFITQGDNRDTADPWLATDDNIRGVAWLHVPKLGTYMAWLRQPMHLGGLAAAIVLMGGISSAETRRRRRHGMRRLLHGSAGQPGGGLPFGGYQPAFGAIAAGAAVFALAFALLGAWAFRSETHSARTASQPAYSETGRFNYAILMEPSTLYPDGILRPPAEAQGDNAAAGPASAPPSAFTALTREAAVLFQYELTAPDAVDLGGTVAADLVIRASGGEWARTTPLLAPQPFTGTTVSATVRIDMIAVGELIAQISKETRLSSTTHEIIVAAMVEGTGTRAGEPIEVRFEQPFRLKYDPTLITPPSELSATVESTAEERVVSPRTLPLLLWSPSVNAARTLAIVGFSTSLGVALVVGLYLLLGVSTDQEARIRALYGSRMVDVEGTDQGPDDDAIRVASMRDLSRLAERFGSVILHQPLPSGHRYYVRDGEDTYEFVSRGNAPGAPGAGANATSTPDSSGG